MLSEYLSRIAVEYVYERAKPFSGSDFGNFVRRDLAVEVKKTLQFWPFDLKVKASVGAGTWAAVPWLAFFDPLVTETATKGFYVVYLVNAHDQTFYLSMIQGTTDVYREFGEKRGREVLKRRSIDIYERVFDHARNFSTEPIDLGSEDSLPLAYEAGHAFGKKYEAGKVTNEILLNDLQKMLYAYEALVNRGGTTPSDVMEAEAGCQEIEETRKYVLSLRIERSPKIRKQVLAQRAPVCECCGLFPERDFSFSGRPEQTPLDVHHATPLNQLAEGETRRYNIPDDFLVLCPTCHRMIHKQNDPSDLNVLKSKMRFTLMRNIKYPTN